MTNVDPLLRSFVVPLPTRTRTSAFSSSRQTIKKSTQSNSLSEYSNKPDRATMRPDCVSACIDFGDKHVTYLEGQMDEQTDETTEEALITHLSII